MERLHTTELTILPRDALEHEREFVLVAHLGMGINEAEPVRNRFRGKDSFRLLER